MDKLDYKELGLKVGLEIHQQLNTKHKLFCGCPTKLASLETPHEEIVRYLKVSKSEIGDVDPAAAYEIQKGRKIIYVVPKGHACLVEMDEEPPHEVNREALAITIAIAKALNSNLIDEIQYMRKIVVDGSNTTGFQRTAIVAIGGHITIEGRRVGIQTIALEEDAARKLEEGPGYVKYNLDRLGIPLIEIATEPDIDDPELAMKVAASIGLLLRLTGRVKRGLGTIRQDLNVSIKGGVKTEIKGVSLLELIPKIVEYEAMRQLRLLKIRDELRARGVKESDVSDEIVNLTDLLKNSKSKLVRRVLKAGGGVYGILLKGFRGILGTEVQPGRRFGTELSDYAKAWGGVGGIIHSDELPKYGISEEEVAAIYETLGGDPSRDAFVLVLADEERARRALGAVIERARHALIGIPKETRGANPDGTTRYLRPQPGAARMYPETDVPPVRVDEGLLREAERIKPPLPDEFLKTLESSHGLGKELAKQLIWSDDLHTYLDIVESMPGIDRKFVASLLVITLRGLRSEGIDVSKLSRDDIVKALHLYHEGKVPKDAVAEVLKEKAQHPEKDLDAIASKYLRLSEDEVRAVVERIVEERIDKVRDLCERSFGMIMGATMKELRGRVEGRLVAAIVKEIINRVCSGGLEG